MGRGSTPDRAVAFEDVERVALGVIPTEQEIVAEALAMIAPFCEGRFAGRPSVVFDSQPARLLQNTSVREQAAIVGSETNRRLAYAICGYVLGWQNEAELGANASGKLIDNFVGPWRRALHDVSRGSHLIVVQPGPTLHLRFSRNDDFALCGEQITESWMLQTKRGRWQQRSANQCPRCADVINAVLSADTERTLLVEEATESTHFSTLSAAERASFAEPFVQRTMEKLATLAGQFDLGRKQVRSQLSAFRRQQLVPKALDQGLRTAIDLFYRRSEKTRLECLFSTSFVSPSYAKTIRWLRNFHIENPLTVRWPDEEMLYQQFILVPNDMIVRGPSDDRLQVQLCARYIGACYPETIQHLCQHPDRPEDDELHLVEECLSIWRGQGINGI